MYRDYEHTIVITNRGLVQGDFFEQMERVISLHPHAVILREKDLTDEAYEELAKRLLELCQREGVSCFLHSRVSVARHLSFFSCCRTFAHTSATEFKSEHLSFYFGQKYTSYIIPENAVSGNTSSKLKIQKANRYEETKCGYLRQKCHNIFQKETKSGRNKEKFQQITTYS